MISAILSAECSYLTHQKITGENKMHLSRQLIFGCFMAALIMVQGCGSAVKTQKRGERYPVARIIASDFAPPFKVSWQMSAGLALYSAVKESKGTLFFGSLDHNLYAVNKKTHKIVWKFKAQDGIWSAVALDDRRVFVAGKDGSVYALRKSNG